MGPVAAFLISCYFPTMRWQPSDQSKREFADFHEMERKARRTFRWICFWVISFVFFVLYQIYSWDPYFVSTLIPRIKMSLHIADQPELYLLIKSCNTLHKYECTRAAAKQLTKFPLIDEQVYLELGQSNFRLGNYKEALKHFEKYDEVGGASSYVWALRASTLEKLGDLKGAIKIAMMALQAEPRYVDLSANLSSWLMTDQRPLEAFSILANLSSSNESMGKALFSKQIAIEKQMRDRMEALNDSEHIVSNKVFRVPSLKSTGGHFFAPLRIGNVASNYVAALVDTGATYVTFNRKTLESSNLEIPESAKPVVMSAAIGEFRALKFNLRHLRLGSLDFDNVEVAYCEQCPNVVGMSVLSRARLRTHIEDGIEYLEISKK